MYGILYRYPLLYTLIGNTWIKELKGDVAVGRMNTTVHCLASVCETQLWLGGAAGQCTATSTSIPHHHLQPTPTLHPNATSTSNSTGLCICPAGFSGSYILNVENDCHMSAAFKEVINAVTLGTSLCLLIGTLAALLKVAIQLAHSTSYRIVPIPTTQGKAVRNQVIVNKGRMPASVRKRQQLAVCDIILFVIFAVCEVYRTTLLFVDPNAFATEVPQHVILVYGLGISCSTCSTLLFMYIYTTSLPKGGQLAAVLGISYDSGRYHKLLNWVFKRNAMFCVVVIGVSNTIQIYKVSSTGMKDYVAVQLVSQSVIGFDLAAVTCFVYYMNVPIFRKIIQHAGQHKKLQKLKIAIFRCGICSAVGIATETFFLFCTIIVSLDSRLNFILYTFVATNEHLFILLGTYLLAYDFVSLESSSKHPKAAHSKTKTCLTEGNGQFINGDSAMSGASLEYTTLDKK